MRIGRFDIMSLIRILLVCVAASLGLSACADDTVPPPTNGMGGRGGTAGSGGTAGPGGSAGSGGAAGSGGTAGSGGSAGSGGAAGSGGSAGSGGTGGTSGTMGGGGTGGALSGACINQDDLAALADLWPSNARQVAADCGIECTDLIVFEEAFTTCASDCVEQMVTGLSAGCATCYGELAWCSRLLCLAPCASNSCLPVCQDCPGYDVCLNELDTCTGRVSLDCTDPT